MLKEINRTATVAWSTLTDHSDLFAAATVASSFDTSAHIEILKFEAKSSAHSIPVLGSISTNDRVQKLVWSPVVTDACPYGVVVGGMPGGGLSVWNVGRILEPNDAEPLIATVDQSNPIQALDVNPNQPSLVASGGSNSELLIWNLESPTSPTKYNPVTASSLSKDNISCVAWNRKVVHILAASNYSGPNVIWDLKSRKAAITFSDPNIQPQRCRAMAWHPEVATQIITASEDDNRPVLQVWDLRNTMSPERYMEGHNRGIWSLSWCSIDPSLLLSCSKGNRTLCWNTTTGQVVSEVDVSSTNFEVQWAPRLKSILSTCSLDGKIRLHSLNDVNPTPLPVAGMQDPFAPQPTAQNLTSPPNWLG